MTVIAERYKTAVTAIGETLTFSQLAGGGAGSAVCVVQVLDSGTMRTMLDDTEVLGLARPSLKFFAAADSGIIVDDVFARDGSNYTVLKVFVHRVRDEAVGLSGVASA
jgi:hypothetical protein